MFRDFFVQNKRERRRSKKKNREPLRKRKYPFYIYIYIYISIYIIFSLGPEGKSPFGPHPGSTLGVRSEKV